MTDANNTDPFADNADTINPLDYAKTKFNKEGELDIEALARGKLEADNHIKTLESEMAELRQKAAQGMAVKDLMEAIRSNKADAGEPTPDLSVNKDTTAQPDTVDIEQLVANTLTKHTIEQKEAVNKQVVVDKLNEVWGDNTTAELRKASSALGVSIKELEDMGKKSPQALFRLLGVDAPVRAPSGTVVPTSTTTIGNSLKNNVRNLKYYSELYKSNPKLRNDSKMAAQELRDALELGEAFFN